MNSVANDIANRLERLRQKSPLVHNITNYVVMNFTANALLAIGAAPVMAHAPEEVEEMAALANALVLNLGTLSSPWIEAMFLAARAAAAHNLPIILDPVGTGATTFRTQTAQRMLDNIPLAVVRANASEILALAGQAGRTRGVDSTAAAESAQATARELAQKYRLVVAMTGPQDYVTDGTRQITIANGHPLMSRITGTGCAATALTGAFCAMESDSLWAAGSALAVFGIAGELAAQGQPGPGTFQINLLDALSKIDRDTILSQARITVA